MTSSPSNSSSTSLTVRGAVRIGVTAALMVVTFLACLPLHNVLLVGYVGVLTFLHGLILSFAMRKIPQRGMLFLTTVTFGLAPTLVGGIIYLLAMAITGALMELVCWLTGGYKRSYVPFLVAPTYAVGSQALLIPLTLLLLPSEKVSAFLETLAWIVIGSSLGTAAVCSVLGAWLGLRLSREMQQIQ